MKLKKKLLVSASLIAFYSNSCMALAQADALLEFIPTAIASALNLTAQQSEQVYNKMISSLGVICATPFDKTKADKLVKCKNDNHSLTCAIRNYDDNVVYDGKTMSGEQRAYGCAITARKGMEEGKTKLLIEASTWERKSNIKQKHNNEVITLGDN
jgi:hypothetical protein